MCATIIIRRMRDISLSEVDEETHFLSGFLDYRLSYVLWHCWYLHQTVAASSSKQSQVERMEVWVRGWGGPSVCMAADPARLSVLTRPILMILAEVRFIRSVNVSACQLGILVFRKYIITIKVNEVTDFVLYRIFNFFLFSVKILGRNSTEHINSY